VLRESLRRAAILHVVTERGDSSWPRASVVIPTFNRCQTLTSVLEALASQVEGRPLAVEAVVVDDGSTDGTWPTLRAWRGGLPLVALRQENAGPARARNRGTAAASGEIVLFLGDDTIPQPGWLEHHLEEHRIHRRASLAVLGYTSFPALDDTPFLRWINEFGAQFGYLLIERGDQLPFNFFYTSNISLPRRVLLDLGGFREDFPAAAWEDTELAYRAVASGLRLLYQPRARVEHRHRILPRTFRRRQRTAGRSAAIFAALHPELGGFLGVPEATPSGLRGAVRDGVHGALVALGERFPGGVSGRVYERYFRRAYLAGLAAGLQGGGRR
jgi:GT2 family glycosyltransferase